jgi:hypothetical protein
MLGNSLAHAAALLALLPALVAAQADAARAPAAAPAAEQEPVIARRLNDSVAVRFAADRRERVLYFFDPRAELTDGDEIEQGPSGQSTLVLAEGGLVEMHASAHLIIDALGRERGDEKIDVLRFPLLTTIEVTSGERKLLCILPGNTQVEFLNGRITVYLVPGRLRIRNEGGNPVEVRGLMTQEMNSKVVSGEGVLTLQRGDEVALPYFRQRRRALGKSAGSWAGLSLRDMGAVSIENDARRLVVSSNAQEGRAVAFTVGGVRAKVEDDSPLVFERHRRGAPTVVEAGSALVQEAAVPAEVPPAGMIVVDLDAYVTAREAGYTNEQMADKNYWVPPSVQAEFDRLYGHLIDAQRGESEDAGQADSGTEPPAAEEDSGAASDSEDPSDQGESP